MVLDVELFRADKGGIPEKIKENQAKRYKDVTLVDKVVEADTKWRKCKSSIMHGFMIDYHYHIHTHQVTGRSGLAPFCGQYSGLPPNPWPQHQIYKNSAIFFTFCIFCNVTFNLQLSAL